MDVLERSVTTLSFIFTLQAAIGLALDDVQGHPNSRQSVSLTSPYAICNPENHIRVDVPNCPANQTILGVVNKLDSLERRTIALQESFQEFSQAFLSKYNTSRYRDCYDVLQSGHSTSGNYIIQPDDDDGPFSVYCDMETDSGGWTVFQRRMDGSLDFYRNWASYKNGFGHMNSEFWMGNDKLFRLTNQRIYKLRVDLEDFEGSRAFASYDYFRVGDSFSGYKLILGYYSGTAGDAFTGHKDMKFSTMNRDNDNQAKSSCARRYKGAWWYTGCHNCNLNGQYLHGEHTAYASGIIWSSWRGYYYSLKHSEMKMRPVV
ncbi:ryncolin-1-like [Glandiceps talaboti]